MSDNPSAALSPALVLASAGALVGYRDASGGAGPLVSMMLMGAGIAGVAPWGTAFVSHVGYRAHQYQGLGRSSWPLPRTGNPNDLAAIGEERKIAFPIPEPGDVALLWSRRKGCYVHAGLVHSWYEGGDQDWDRNWFLRVRTIEGNVTADGKPGGRGIFIINRRFARNARTLFLRWTLLDARSSWSDPSVDSTVEMGQRQVRRAGRNAA